MNRLMAILVLFLPLSAWADVVEPVAQDVTEDTVETVVEEVPEAVVQQADESLIELKGTRNFLVKFRDVRKGGNYMSKIAVLRV